MKTILSLILILGLRALSTAQEESFTDFRREFNPRDGVHSFTVPGFLVRLVGSIALKEEDAIDREAIRPLLRNMGSVSLIYTEDGHSIDRDDLIRLRENLLDEKYETLLTVKEDNSHIEIMSWGKKDVIKRLVLLIDEDDDETIVLNIRGHFTQDAIQEMVDSLEKRERKKW